VPNQEYQKKQKSSQFKGVVWHKRTGKWHVQIQPKGDKQMYGGYFKDELDAAQRVNHICEELGVPPQNPEISGMLNQQCEKKEKNSQYKGVFWNKTSGKWFVLIYLKGQKPKYGGCFNDELKAGKKVNQLCEELEIPLRNPKINACEKNEKTSKYKGISWHRERRKWFVRIYPKEQKPKYGGYFQDELDAAKRVNQLCEELEIPLLNPEIGAMPNQQYQKKTKDITI